VSNRTKTVTFLPRPGATTEPTLEGDFVKVEVTYSSTRKAYYVSATPVFCKTERGYTSESFWCFSGKTAKLEAAPRFNAKRLEALAAAESTKELYAPLVAALEVELASGEHASPEAK